MARLTLSMRSVMECVMMEGACCMMLCMSRLLPSL